jgi:hypothetical protein
MCTAVKSVGEESFRQEHRTRTGVTGRSMSRLMLPVASGPGSDAPDPEVTTFGPHYCPM